MHYGLINAAERTAVLHDADRIQDCYSLIGLDALQLDHGVVVRRPDSSGIGIFVYEYGLMQDPAQTNYFSIGRGLYAGNAVIYAFDANGESVELKIMPPIMFYRSFKEVEQAIQRGEINRPFTAVNEAITWAWNYPE
jgi:hypothetical protein